MDNWVLLTLETHSGAWCVSERSWKQLESPQGLVRRKLRAVCYGAVWRLERACNRHNEAEVVTSRMEAEMLAAHGNVLSLIQTQPDRSEEASWCFIWWVAQLFCAGSRWGTELKFCQLFSFSDLFFILNSKCVFFLKKLIALENDFQLER